MVLAVDARRERRWTGRSSSTEAAPLPDCDALEWLRQGTALGAGEILLTSMDRDGTQDGFDLELLRAAVGGGAVPVIACGGAGDAADCAAAITEGRADAVLAASIFHRSQTAIAEVKHVLAAAGVPVREVA